MFNRTTFKPSPDEVIEAFLLLQEVERGRLGGFLLEGQVHTLVGTVLLWPTGDVPPAKFEMAYYWHLNGSAMAA